MKRFLFVLTTLLLTFGIASFCYAIPGEDGTPAMGDGVTAQEITPSALLATGKCNTTKVDFAAADGAVPTASSTFVDVPDMSVTFKIPAETPRSCVRVEFSAFAYAPGTELMFLRAFLDGTTVGLPGEVQFESNAGTYATARAFNFLFTNVKAGTHTITMQYLNGGTAGNVYLHARDMFVHHK